MATRKTTQPQFIPGTVETRPDDAAPGVQIDGQGLEPAAESIPANTPGRYYVCWHIKANGKRYAPGEVVELDDDVAMPFLESGAINGVMD